MKFREYIDTYEVDLSWFAETHSISQATVYKLYNGHNPSQSIAERIEKATKEKVKVLDLRKKDKRIKTKDID